MPARICCRSQAIQTVVGICCNLIQRIFHRQQIVCFVIGIRSCISSGIGDDEQVSKGVVFVDCFVAHRISDGEQVARNVVGIYGFAALRIDRFDHPTIVVIEIGGSNGNICHRPFQVLFIVPFWVVEIIVRIINRQGFLCLSEIPCRVILFQDYAAFCVCRFNNIVRRVILECGGVSVPVGLADQSAACVVGIFSGCTIGIACPDQSVLTIICIPDCFTIWQGHGSHFQVTVVGIGCDTAFCVRRLHKTAACVIFFCGNIALRICYSKNIAFVVVGIACGIVLCICDGRQKSGFIICFGCCSSHRICNGRWLSFNICVRNGSARIRYLGKQILGVICICGRNAPQIRAGNQQVFTVIDLRYSTAAGILNFCKVIFCIIGIFGFVSKFVCTGNQVVPRIIHVHYAVA
ncbi:hypothetical protein IMSAG013_00598 [Clostridiales bacterium]|nr:hypothetical protein IMSAG013_00598 [Clostridiales bacterium]